MKNPQIPVPKSLGGGLMAMHVRRGPRLGDCTTPGCATVAATSCTFPLAGGSGRTCGKPICGTHSTDGLCPPHARMLARRTQRP